MRAKQGSGKTIKCVMCGAPRYVPPCHLSRSPKYCSKVCQTKAHTKIPDELPKYIVKSCEECGSTFRTLYRVERGGYGKFCSMKCGNIAKGRARTAKGKNLIKLPCFICKRSIERYPSRVARYNVCSDSCRVLMLMRNKGRTDIEIKMADMLTELSVEFTEQVPMYDRWVADFVVEDSKLVIFCDGLYWHSRPEVIAKDKGQTNYLIKSGWKVLRFTDHDILKSPTSVIATITASL